MRGKGAKLTRQQALDTLAIIRSKAAEGFPATGGGGRRTIIGEAARAVRMSPTGLRHRIQAISFAWPDLAGELEQLLEKKSAAAFTIETPPDNWGVSRADEPIDDLLDAIERRSINRGLEKQRRLVPVRIATPGPIAVAILGDIHIDDPGVAMRDLREDVQILKQTEGMYGIGVGDYRNNWVGRLVKLYAEQETTQSQALRLIEWFFSETDGKLIAAVAGNHDLWNGEGGDAVEIMHRLARFEGLYGEPSYRLKLTLPAGCSVNMHIRHDFPGKSQFNPAHGALRESLFGYRDHVIACGDRHHSGYMPYWHNDPERLIHCIRVGCYKDHDKYALEKGFRWENWARSMVVIIDPAHADNPVEYLSVRFSLRQGALELERRRKAWRDEQQAAKSPSKGRGKGAAGGRRTANDGAVSKRSRRG